MKRDLVAKALSLLTALENDVKSQAFRHPVDHVGLGLSDYLTIIKHPMDLSTVKVYLYKFDKHIEKFESREL